jgi:Brp/Blh family beta-carotene 15,15'-monooxygenase
MTHVVPIAGRETERAPDPVPSTVRPAVPPSVPVRAARPAAVAAAVSRCAVAAVLVAQLVVPGGWGSFAWIPLVAGLLLGLPHGAVDHLVPGFRLGCSVPRTVRVAAAYALLALAVLVAFRAWPAPALALFVVLSAAHFGTGETAFHDLRAGRAPGVDVLGAAAFGGAVIVLPLLHHRDAVAPVVALVVPGTTGLLPVGPSRAGELAVLVLAAAAVVVRLARGRPGPAAELVLVTVAALVVPPAAFFGAYFGTWHSGRHTARLVVEDPANAVDLAAARLARPLLRFARTAALPTAAALATVLALWTTARGWQGFVAADLAVLAALTVPHVVVVGWLDAQQRRAARRA